MPRGATRATRGSLNHRDGDWVRGVGQRGAIWGDREKRRERRGRAWEQHSCTGSDKNNKRERFYTRKSNRLRCCVKAAHVLLTALIGVDVCTNVSARMLRLQDEIASPRVACTRRAQRRRKRRAPQRHCAACHIRQEPYSAADRRSVHRAPPCSKVCAGRGGAGRHCYSRHCYRLAP